MTKWRVVYKGPSGNNLYHTLDSENYDSAKELKDAIVRGEEPDLFITAGAIVAVEKME